MAFYTSGVMMFKNFAQSNLASSMNTTQTTLTLTTGTGTNFPSPSAGQFFVACITDAATQLITEIVQVTNVTGDVFTIVRAQESTTARNWNIGDFVSLYVTDGTMEYLTQAATLQIQPGNTATDTGSANAMVVTLSQIPVSLASIEGSPLRILKSSAPNTGATTLNVNGLGNIPVTTNGVALKAGALLASQYFEVVYDGTSFEVIGGSQQLPNAGANTFLANNTGSSAPPIPISVAAALTELGFGSESISTDGYYTFPNGLIIQWGISVSASPAGAGAVSFPLTFPNACFAVVVMPINVTLQATAQLNSGTINAVSFGYQNFISGTGAGPLDNYWIAIGH